MARDIARIDQRNLWGISSDDAANALEPQRADLWAVDFTTAVQSLNKVARTQLSQIPPQLAQSVTLPEIRVKSDPVRRDSMGFQTSSWDDPLDPLKITFLMDSRENQGSALLRFLEVWMAVVRAGRGDRGFLYYNTSQTYLLLDEDYRNDCQFNFIVKFLRGSMPVNLGSGLVQATRGSFLQNAATSPFVQALAQSASNHLNLTDVGAAALRVSEDFNIRRAWLGGYKVSDLSYKSGTELVSVEATFYAEDVQRILETPTSLGPIVPVDDD